MLVFAAGARADSLTGTELEARTDELVAKFAPDRESNDAFAAHLETLWKTGGNTQVRDALERLTARILGPDDGERARKIRAGCPSIRIDGFRVPPFEIEEHLMWLLEDVVDHPQMAFPGLEAILKLRLDDQLDYRWDKEKFIGEPEACLEFLRRSGFLADVEAFSPLLTLQTHALETSRGTYLGRLVSILRQELSAEESLPYRQLLARTETFGARLFLAALRRDEGGMKALIRDHRETILSWTPERQAALALFFREEMPLEPLEPEELKTALTRRAQADWEEFQVAKLEDLPGSPEEVLATLATENPAVGRLAIGRLSEIWNRTGDQNYGPTALVHEAIRLMEPRLGLRFLLEVLGHPEVDLLVIEEDLGWMVRYGLINELEARSSTPAARADDFLGIVTAYEPAFEKAGMCLSGMIFLSCLVSEDELNVELARRVAAKPKTPLWEEFRRVLTVCEIYGKDGDFDEQMLFAETVYAAQLQDARFPEKHREAKRRTIRQE